MRLGYNHRGIEKACESRSYVQSLYLIERVCGICSHTHSTCFIQAVEEIAGVEVPPRALAIRTIFAELERIHSHLLWLGVAGVLAAAFLVLELQDFSRMASLGGVHHTGGVERAAKVCR